MSFDKLLADLQSAQTEQGDLAKSLTTTGEDTAAGGEGGAGAGGEGGGNDTLAGGEGGAGEQGLAKSMQVTLPDGTVADAIDGTEMLKALQARLETGETTMVKAMGSALDLIKSQGAMIKSLSDQVKALATQGRGRKTVLAIAEKNIDLHKSHGAGGGEGGGGSDDGLTVETFLAKSEDAFNNKRITGVEFTTIDVACRMGSEVSPALVKKVLAGGVGK